MDNRLHIFTSPKRANCQRLMKYAYSRKIVVYQADAYLRTYVATQTLF
jgi:hypothetical protein